MCSFHLLLLFFIIGGVGLSPYVLLKSLGTAATSGLLYKPWMIDEDQLSAEVQFMCHHHNMCFTVKYNGYFSTTRMHET
jgi:hypothetical protein